MRILSAADSFNPAIERAKSILLPFNLRLWIKLGIVSLLAEIGSQLAFPPLRGSSPSTSGEGTIGSLPPQVLALIVLTIAIVFCTVGLVFYYIGSRMQMVFMDIAATRDTRVGPSWQRHGVHTWRWIGLKLLCLFTVFLIGGVFIALPAIYFFRSALPDGNQQVGPAFFGSFLLFFIGIFFLVFVVLAIMWLLRDLVLPFIVFQDATLQESVGYAMQIMRHEPGAVLMFLGLKFVFALAVGLAAELALLLATLAGAIPLGAIGGVLWLVLRHAGDAATVLLYIALGLLGLVFIAWFLVVAICAVGATQLFLQAYALYFMGGRYPLLGNLLEPQLPSFGYPNPPPPPPAPPSQPGWLPPLSEPIE